jgi:hypothetical protein
MKELESGIVIGSLNTSDLIVSSIEIVFTMTTLICHSQNFGVTIHLVAIHSRKVTSPFSLV